MSNTQTLSARQHQPDNMPRFRAVRKATPSPAIIAYCLLDALEGITEFLNDVLVESPEFSESARFHLVRARSAIAIAKGDAA